MSVGPEQSDPLSYVSGQLQRRIASFHSSVRWYRWRYYVAVMAMAGVSALITILAGWKSARSTFMDNLILILGATATVLSVWGAFFSPRESWLVYASTLNKLRALQARIDFHRAAASNRAADGAEADAMFEEYQSILAAHNADWLALRSGQNRQA